ncbi:MAG: aspartyl-phosphate phosphatase Spo0E family protein [Clostridia bacterium]|nr:aspartyl-phosphate phosphatase Spo0E family protein [Clostridia bacterium]
MVTMLIDQICSLRDKLNKSILTEDYEYTYELSIELDELIAEYYKQNYNVEENDDNKNK